MLKLLTRHKQREKGLKKKPDVRMTQKKKNNERCNNNCTFQCKIHNFNEKILFPCQKIIIITLACFDKVVPHLAKTK